MLQGLLSSPSVWFLTMLLLSRTCAAQTLWSQLNYVPGQDVTLAPPLGPVVTMDIANPAAVGKLTISTACQLVFQPTLANVLFTCREIEVQSGALLQVGSVAAPAIGPVEIVLRSAPGFRGMLQVRPGGTIEVHGQALGKSWTQLQATAPWNQSTLTVPASDVQGWRNGDAIVVAATDFLKVQMVQGPTGFIESFLDQSELKLIQGNLAGTITLNSALAYEHHGQHVATTIDERAEVGLLTRTVRIKGDVGGTTLRPHVLLGDVNPQPPLAPLTAHIEWAEFTGLGDPPQAHRYPLHFHRLGNMSGSYVKNCSLHHNLQHGLVVHETDHLQVEGNVFFDTYGWHLWMQREGATFPKHNTVSGNLAILARDLTLETDPQQIPLNSAACFFLTHFDNDFLGNHAVGSQASGFWCDTVLDNGKWGVDHTMGRFEDNVVHSCGDHGFYLEGRTEFSKQDPIYATPPYTGGVFKRLHAYKNNGFGAFWHNFGGSLWEDLQIADNGAGIYPASEGRWEDEYRAIEVILGGKIIGESPSNTGWVFTPAEGAYGRSLPSRRPHNLYHKIAGDPPYHAPELTGLNLYDGLVHVEGVEFRGFVDSLTYPIRGHAGAFAPAAYDNPWAVDPRNIVKACTLASFAGQPASNWVWFRPYATPYPNPPWPENPNGVNNTILNDMDGSLLPVVQPPAAPGGVIYLAGNAHLATAGTTALDAAWNAKYLASTHPFGQAVLYGFAPHNVLATVTYLGATDSITPRLIPEIQTRANTPDYDYDVYMHAWNLPAKAAPTPANRHVLGMENSDELTGTITVMFTGNATGSVAEFELPYRGVITGAYAARGYADAKYQINGGNLIPPAATFSAWMAATGTGWYFDSGAEKLYVRIVLPASNSGTNAQLRGGMFTGAPVYFRFSG